MALLFRHPGAQRLRMLYSLSRSWIPDATANLQKE